MIPTRWAGFRIQCVPVFRTDTCGAQPLPTLPGRLFDLGLSGTYLVIFINTPQEVFVEVIPNSCAAGEGPSVPNHKPSTTQVKTKLVTIVAVFG